VAHRPVELTSEDRNRAHRAHLPRIPGPARPGARRRGERRGLPFRRHGEGRKLPGREGYRRDYHRWPEAFPDGEVKIVMQNTWAVVEFVNRGKQTGPLHSSLGIFRRAEGAWRCVIAASCGWPTAWLSRAMITRTRRVSPGNWSWPRLSPHTWPPNAISIIRK
jgi:hypothetical protein